jgi:hypothetical protein
MGPLTDDPGDANMDSFRVRVVTSTGVVLRERLLVSELPQGAGTADMLRAQVWHAVHPNEQVHLVVDHGVTNQRVLNLQLMPAAPDA